VALEEAITRFYIVPTDCPHNDDMRFPSIRHVLIRS
jgi:hypothetical protein